jgi:hypothetical protein
MYINTDMRFSNYAIYMKHNDTVYKPYVASYIPFNRPREIFVT